MKKNLKKFFKKIKITKDIDNEVSVGKTGASEIEEACKEWIILSKPTKIEEVNSISKLEGIEKADASIILLAKEENDLLLSNDYALIMTARAKGIKCWWLTTFILRCLNNKLITKKEAKQILLDLIEAGMRLDSIVYTAILEEIEKYNK